MVFVPNITTNHAVTYTNKGERGKIEGKEEIAQKAEKVGKNKKGEMVNIFKTNYPFLS